MNPLRAFLRSLLSFFVGPLPQPIDPEALRDEAVRLIETIRDLPELIRLRSEQEARDAAAQDPALATLPAEEDDESDAAPEFQDPRQPMIFTYWDGRRQRSVDPLRTWVALQSNDKINLSLAAEQVATGDVSIYPELIPFCREFFGLSAWSEETPDGLTDQGAVDVLYQFWSFADAAKKKLDRPQNLPRLTESQFWARSHQAAAAPPSGSDST